MRLPYLLRTLFSTVDSRLRALRVEPATVRFRAVGPIVQVPEDRLSADCITPRDGWHPFIGWLTWVGTIVVAADTLYWFPSFWYGRLGFWSRKKRLKQEWLLPLSGLGEYRVPLPSIVVIRLDDGVYQWKLYPSDVRELAAILAGKGRA